MRRGPKQRRILEESVCESCNRVYAPSRPEQRFCCRECARATHGRRMQPKKRNVTSLRLVVGGLDDTPTLTPGEERRRPKTRGDCERAERPCPWVSCIYHLWPDLIGKDPLDMEETCALDIADRGDHTLQEIGDILGITKERARQIEEVALRKLRRRADPEDFAGFLTMRNVWCEMELYGVDGDTLKASDIGDLPPIPRDKAARSVTTKAAKSNGKKPIGYLPKSIEEQRDVLEKMRNASLWGLFCVHYRRKRGPQ